MQGFEAVAEASSGFYEVFFNHRLSVVLLRRTAEPYRDDAAVREETQRVNNVLDQLGRERSWLLVDARLAPLDTDTRMATAFREQREEVRKRFRGVAVVVRTQVGRLQARRLAAELGPGKEDPVFDDIEAALSSLTSR